MKDHPDYDLTLNISKVYTKLGRKPQFIYIENIAKKIESSLKES